LYHQVHQQQEQASTLAGVINAIPNATLILNGQATVILANPMAYQIVQQEPSMQIQSERLQFQRREDHYRFFELVSDCIRASMGQQAYATGSMFIERHLQPPLIACLSPIEGIAQQRGGAMMTIYDPQVRQLPSAALIAEYFSLTKAEALLCEGLCSGLSLKDIAESRHKSEATLRSYLKQVFLKTGLNRQGQLVSHILAALMH
jgi:DNA-binding CsgD family transcriptional regulator